MDLLCRDGDFGDVDKHNTRIIKVPEREQMVKAVWRDSKHKHTAMRFAFTLNYRVQSLGRKMEAPRFHLGHMYLEANDDFEDIADDCRVLGLESYGTDKKARGAREKGVTRHKNFHLCSFAAAAYQLAWTNDCAGKEVISYVRHALDRQADRRHMGSWKRVTRWRGFRLIFGKDQEDTASESLLQKDWEKYIPVQQVRACMNCPLYKGMNQGGLFELSLACR